MDQTTNETKSLCKLGLSYSDAGRYEEAIKAFDKALEINPNWAKVYFYRGNANYSLKGFEDAISDYTKAILLFPDEKQAYINRARAYKKLNMCCNAIDDLTLAIATIQNDGCQNYAHVYFERGLVYDLINKSNLAILDFNSAVKINPKDYLAFSNLGRLYFKTHRFKQAILNATISIELNPEYFLSFSIRGSAYYYLDQLELAVPDLDRSILLNNQFAYPHLYKAFICEKNGKADDAIIEYKEFIKHASQQDVNSVEFAKSKIEKLIQ